jgi:phage baseplate assembly protein W
MSKLYQTIQLPAVMSNPELAKPKMFKGFSTVSLDTDHYNLYDFDLIKQDLLNHFHVRQGERLMQPTFGTIIWDLVFEPLTEQLKNMILNDVTTIVNYDPRISASSVQVSTYDSGIQVDCTLTFNPYNISQTMQLRFDQANGLLTQ